MGWGWGWGGARVLEFSEIGSYPYWEGVFQMGEVLTPLETMTYVIISCECKCKFDCRKSGIMINVNISAKIQKNIKHVITIFETLLRVVKRMLNI